MITDTLVIRTLGLLSPSIIAFLARHNDPSLYIKIILMDQSGGDHKTLLTHWLFSDSNNSLENPDYVMAADGKAKYTLRTGNCSRESALDGAHLVLPGDVIWAGCVNWNGLVVSVSGAADAMVDEGIANMIAAAIIMECQAEVNELRKQDAWTRPE